MREKSTTSITPEQVDALLPQTQCGLCGYGGCMPYAEALVYENAAINLCPPGGVSTLRALGHYLQQDPAPFMADMEKTAKPKQLAVIREDECIGCVKCIQACPVDAIIGSAKQMHTIITDACTGCELCIPPCPVDCIDLLRLSEEELDPAILEKNKDLARTRYNKKLSRLSKEKAAKNAANLAVSLVKRKRYIEEALSRAKNKKISSA